MEDYTTICYSEAKFLQKPEHWIIEREVSDLEFSIH